MRVAYGVVVLRHVVVQPRIADDGRGFEPDRQGASDRGFGLASLRSRVSDLGGAIGVESQPGEGTTIAISLPLTAERR